MYGLQNHRKPSDVAFPSQAAQLSVPVLCCPIAGRMAAAWLFLLTFSLNLLIVGGFRLPTISFLIQEGPPGKDVGAHRLAGNEGPASAAPQKWEWKAAAEGDLRRPLASRRRREDRMVSKNSTNDLPKKSLPTVEAKAEDTNSLGLTSEGKMAEPTPNVTTAPASQGKVSQDVAATASNGVAHFKTPKQAVPSPAPKTSPNVGEVSTVTKGAQDGGRHFVSEGVPVATLNSSEVVLPGRENATVSLTEAGNVSTTTEHWPWLYDVTSDTPQMLTEDARVSTSAQWQEGKKKRKGDFPFRKAVPSPTTDWPWMHDLSTASSLTWVDNLDLSTATREEERDTHQPIPRAKGRSGFSPKTATTGWPWLEEISTPSSQTLMEDYDSSTVTLGQILGTEKTGRKGKGTADSHLRPATAGGPTAATSTTALVKPPSAVSPRGAPDLLGKCLLAILLLALVAAIFIVITTILAIVLWRQKRAYKRNGQNHTEMVCISSLLAAEEAEEAKQRQPKVKRLKMLGDSNGLETEMDNLTLNSFLPEH